VLGYYQDIFLLRFRDAWDRLGPTLQTEFGGYDSWKAGYRRTLTVRAFNPIVIARSRDEASVSVSIRSLDLDACGDRVSQRFGGTWSLVRDGLDWRLMNADITKVGGEELVTDAGACPSGGGGGGIRAAGPGTDSGYSYGRPYPDLDCEDFSGSVYVGSSDPNGLDADGDGIGCE
jgi:hypothetical protein